MLNEASLTRLRNKLLGGCVPPLTPPERAFLASLIANHVTGMHANELYLSPVRLSAKEARAAMREAGELSADEPVPPRPSSTALEGEAFSALEMRARSAITQPMPALTGHPDPGILPAADDIPHSDR